MGSKTLNDIFYKPDIGASGAVEKGKFDDGLDVADGFIEGNKPANNKLSALAVSTSEDLAGVISDKTGTGKAVFGTSPVLVTPVLGTPASGNLINCTYLTSAVHAYKTTSQTFTAGGSVLVTFDKELYDTNNEFDLNAERFTALKAGRYLVSLSILASAVTIDKRYSASIKKNGVNVVASNRQPSVNDYFSADCLGVVELAVDDYLEAWFFTPTGTTFTNSTNNPSETYFSITRVQ